MIEVRSGKVIGSVPYFQIKVKAWIELSDWKKKLSTEMSVTK